MSGITPAPTMLVKVISGGQTGADRAALIAAHALGIVTGGWMPRGFVAQDGSHPEFAQLYGVRDTTSDRYQPRTALNVRESDGTVLFATVWDSPGEVLTKAVCRKLHKPHLEVTPGERATPADVAVWLAGNAIRVLNVAGNSERTSPGIQESVVEFLGEVFRLLVLSHAAAHGR